MNKRKLNKCRQFSEQIRKNVVSEFRSGKYTVRELSDLYHVSTTSIYRWIHKYSPAESPGINVVEMADSTDKKLNDLQQQIADLERALGQKQIKVDLLAKLYWQIQPEGMGRDKFCRIFGQLGYGVSLPKTACARPFRPIRSSRT